MANTEFNIAELYQWASRQSQNHKTAARYVIGLCDMVLLLQADLDEAKELAIRERQELQAEIARSDDIVARYNFIYQMLNTFTDEQQDLVQATMRSVMPSEASTDFTIECFNSAIDAARKATGTDPCKATPEEPKKDIRDEY